MVADPALSSATHVPVYFPAGGESLFGLHTRTDSQPGGTAVLIASGGLTGTSTVGRNQLYVCLSRALADDGLHSMRFDYHGIGESTGLLEEFRLDAEEPFVDDILGAARYLEHQGVDELLVMGKCFGSRMALSATRHLDRLDGVILIGPPVRDFGKGERVVARLATELSMLEHLRRGLRFENLRNLRDRRRRAVYMRVAAAKLRAVRERGLHRSQTSSTSTERRDLHWVSPKFLAPLERLVERGVPVQLIYGIDDGFYRDFRQASRHGRLAAILDQAGPGIEVTEVSGLVRGFVTAAGQEAIIRAALGWIGRRETELHPSPLRRPAQVGD